MGEILDTTGVSEYLCTLSCSNLHSEDIIHKDHIDTYFSKLIDVMEKSSVHIPDTCLPSESCRIPGWNVEIKPYRNEAPFWKKAWASQGRPIAGFHAQMMR